MTQEEIAKEEQKRSEEEEEKIKPLKDELELKLLENECEKIHAKAEFLIKL